MKRNEKSAYIIAIAAIVFPTAASFVPDSIKDQFLWIWILLISIGFILVLVAIALLFQDSLLELIKKQPLIRTMLEIKSQINKPSKFLYIQEARFNFLSMSEVPFGHFHRK
jgi:MFS family permease